MKNAHSFEGMPAYFNTPFTKERLAGLQSLHIEILTDLSPLLQELNSALRTNMKPREEGQHITIITPVENKILQELSEEQIEDLDGIRRQIAKGVGIEICGIGYIDGSSYPNLREVDQNKRVSFISLSIPALQEFREAIGLAHKDFHVTLGFEGGDIFSEIVGKKESGGNILGPIPKRANPELSNTPIPELKFGGLSGQEK